MIRSITLENYMSHAHTVIEPAAGLTVLVGPNNCGKSAVVSALETLCNNASGAYMVRHSEKEARVSVETDDGHTFVWSRRGNTVSYIIDGREIHRLGRSAPEDLHKLLRLPKVEAGENGEPFDIHFGTQKSPIFLLNEPESRAAVFFASSSDAAILLEMQKRHRNKVKERKNDEKRLRREIENLDAELDALKPLDVLATSMGQAEDQYRKLKELDNQIQAFRDGLETLRVHLVKHNRLAREHQCLAALESPPHLVATDTLNSLIADLRDAEEQLERDRARSGALRTLRVPPGLEDVPTLANTVQFLADAERNCSAWSQRWIVVKDLQLPPALDDVESVESLCRALSCEEKNHRIFRAMAASLGFLHEPPAIEDTSPLERLVASLESTQPANAALCQRARVLEGLTLPPELADPKPLAELISQVKDTSQNVAQHKGLINSTAVQMDVLEAGLSGAECANAQSLLPIPLEWRARTRSLMALGGFAGLAAILLLVFGPSWFGQRNIDTSDRTHMKVDPPVGLAEADPDGKTGRMSGPHQAVEKVTPKEELNRQELKSERPKNVDLMLKKEESDVTRQLRLKEVQQLLADAEAAYQKDKYLEALLGFGQAAVLYPQELAAVENPERVRRRFLEALKRYQTEVERALLKAAKPDPKAPDPNSR